MWVAPGTDLEVTGHALRHRGCWASTACTIRAHVPVPIFVLRRPAHGLSVLHVNQGHVLAPFLCHEKTASHSAGEARALRTL
jgi:hypothetical protein